MNHNIGRAVFATVVGLLVAWFSYQWITDPAGREQRDQQIAAVEASRAHLRAVVSTEALQIVDPVSPDRKVGKVYVYPLDDGWSVSGYYRRTDTDRWHAYLMDLTPELNIKLLKIQDGDSALIERAASDAQLEVTP